MTDCKQAPGYPPGFGIENLEPTRPGELRWRMVRDCFPPAYSADPELRWGDDILEWGGEPLDWAAAP